jgi:hypothetical protein
MSSVNSDSLTTSFPICVPLISSSYLIALARNSKTMLNKSGETGHPCLIPVFRRNGFSFSPLSMMLAMGLSCIPFIMLRYVHSIPDFLRDFYHDMVLNFIKGFSLPIEMTKIFLSLLLLMCCITFIDLCMLNHPCIFGIKPT